ncbi:MAG: type II secretion system protein J, partial [Planctomyces sp.]
MKRDLKRQPAGISRTGFTLVEMLVSVALVLLMMSLFASIFSMASGSVSTQRGISNHDQKARALTTLIKGDFSHRTQRYPLPFYPTESTATSPTPFGNRAGYLYISTNDPYSGQDDLVQFTVSADMLQEDTDSSPYYGRAVLLNDPSGNTSTSLSVNPNQPEADDSSLTVNNTGSSTAAEVCYFVRNGNLYRRVMLLRQPLPVAGRELDEQPTTSRGQDYFTSGSGNFSVQTSSGAVATDDFWTYFDYSATAAAATGKAQFVGLSALNNEQARTVPAVANPAYRFGFNQFTGISREHAVLNGAFIGRFLQAETSAVNFNWPQRRAVLF